MLSSRAIQDLSPTNPSLLKVLSPAIGPTGVELNSFASAPSISGGLSDLAHSLLVRDIQFECEGEGTMAQLPAFPAAVRQVIGTELMKTASREALAGLPCPWSPACGLHVFFNGQVTGEASGDASRLMLPPPWVLRTESTGINSMRITIRLFGLGLLWTGELAEAGHRAIEQGICIGTLGSVCQGVLHRSIEDIWTGIPDEAEGADRALLSFNTPYMSASGPTQPHKPEAGFLEAMLVRSRAIAHWHGMKLDSDDKELQEALRQTATDGRGLGQVDWKRSLSQKGGQSVVMSGYMGLLQFRLGDSFRDPLIQLLHIGSLLHGGDQVAFGMGRYDLILMPG